MMEDGHPLGHAHHHHHHHHHLDRYHHYLDADEASLDEYVNLDGHDGHYHAEVEQERVSPRVSLIWIRY